MLFRLIFESLPLLSVMKGAGNYIKIREIVRSICMFFQGLFESQTKQIN